MTTTALATRLWVIVAAVAAVRVGAGLLTGTGQPWDTAGTLAATILVVVALAQIQDLQRPRRR